MMLDTLGAIACRRRGQKAECSFLPLRGRGAPVLPFSKNSDGELRSGVDASEDASVGEDRDPSATMKEPLLG